MRAKEVGGAAAQDRKRVPLRTVWPRLQPQDVIPPLVLIVVGLAVYHNSFAGPFIFDDICSIPNNPHIRRLWPPWQALSPPAHCTIEGRPLANFSLAVNYALGRLNVWGYHAFNLAVHVLAALVLCGVVHRTLTGPRLQYSESSITRWLALAAALVWMVHPLQTESVTYVIQRTESLMGLFYLLTLYCVIRGHGSVHRRAWYAAAVVASAMGMASKEVMVTAPLIVLLYDRTFFSTSFREALRGRYRLYGGLASTWLVLAAAQMATSHPTAGFGLGHLTPWGYAMTQPGVILHYLRLALWPSPLVIDYYGWPIVRGITAAALVVAGLLCATLWALYRRRAGAFLGAWFFLILAPTSSILPLAGEVAAERRMYLPLAAVVTLVVMAVHAALQATLRQPHVRRGVQAAVLVIIATALGVVTARRNEDYRSLISIWKDVVTKRPNNARAHMNLGHYLAEDRRIAESRAEYAEAVRSEPTNADAHYGLAVLLALQGKTDDAIAEYSEALRINPNHAQAHAGLGAALARQGKLQRP